MAKPASHIDWTEGNPDQATISVEPTGAKKEAGWLPAERPSRKTMNWLFQNIDEWIKYLEVETDKFSNFDAVVASSGGTHTTLQAAHDDAVIVPGSRIFVTESVALDSVVSITKNDLEIYFKPNVTYSKGGGAPAKALSLGPTAHGVRVWHGRFAGFNGVGESGIEVAAAANYVMLLNNRFSNNTKDVEDNGNTTITIQSPVTE